MLGSKIPVRVVLFYPVRSIGGAQLAFARLGRELARRPEWRIVLVDYADGFIRRMFTEWRMEFDFVLWEPGLKQVEVGDSVMFLSLHSLPESLLAIRSMETSRLLLWSLHPHAVLGFFRFGFVYNRMPVWARRAACRLLEPLTWRRVGALLDDFASANALLFMDGPNQRFPCSLGYRAFETPYMPVPIETGRTAELGWQAGVSIGWLGRLARDKSHTIYAMLELLSRHAAEQGGGIDFHIVGDGPALERLQTAVTPGVRLHFPGVLRDQQLANYLGANVKVGFAMGTCLLEFSTLGIPVLVGDYSNDPIPADRLPLRWFVPNEDYSLGEVIGETPLRPKVDIAEVARLCADREALRELGQRCREYAERSHRIDQVCERLTGHLDATRYRYESARSKVKKVGRPLGPALAKIFHRSSKPKAGPRAPAPS